MLRQLRNALEKARVSFHTLLLYPSVPRRVKVAHSRSTQVSSRLLESTCKYVNQADTAKRVESYCRTSAEPIQAIATGLSVIYRGRFFSADRVFVED